MDNALHDENTNAVIQKILVAIDGSHHARRAARLAAIIAARQGAHVTLLHVLLTSTPYAKVCGLAETYRVAAETLERLRPLGPAGYEDGIGFPINVMNPVMPAELLIEIGRCILESHKDLVRAHGVSDVSLMMEDGDPADKIIEIAGREKPELIFMGHRGLGPVQELLMGSVSMKVNHLAPISVVTVK